MREFEARWQHWAMGQTRASAGAGIKQVSSNSRKRKAEVLERKRWVSWRASPFTRTGSASAVNSARRYVASS